MLNPDEMEALRIENEFNEFREENANLSIEELSDWLDEIFDRLLSVEKEPVLK